MTSIRKKAIAVAVLALALAVGATAARAAASAGEAATEEGRGGEAQASEARETGRIEYSGEAERLAELLESGVWVGASGDTVRFERGSAGVVGKGEEPSWRQFSITSAEPGEGGDGWTASAEVDGRDCVLTVGRAKPESGAEQPWRLSCTALGGDRVLSPPSSGVSVEEVGDGLLEAIGGEEVVGRLEEELSEACSSRYPTATRAVPLGEAALDTEAGDVTLTLELDSPAGATVTAVVSAKDGAVSLEEV